MEDGSFAAKKDVLLSTEITMTSGMTGSLTVSKPPAEHPAGGSMVAQWWLNQVASMVSQSSGSIDDTRSLVDGAIHLTDRQNEILSIIQKNNKIGYRDIAKELGINDSAVKKHMNKLKELGVLKRVGGTRGHWEVLDET